MLISFADSDRSHKRDETGHNKVGYITQMGEVIFPLRSRIARRSLSKIERLPSRKVPIPDGFDANCVEKFFVENFQTIDLFNQGLMAIVRGEFGYFSNPIKLPRLNAIDIDERNSRWNELRLRIRERDLLFTFDTKSAFSNVISFIDNGPWSHVAMCTGQGTIIEAIAAGVQERPLEVYADPRYRVGLYRPIGLTEVDGGSLEFLRSQIGKPYAYAKAALAGAQKLFGISRFAPTPNDLAVSRHLQLIGYA